ncbi:MAG: delta-aminolevulinic acid dehydratase [Pyrinomonadaceae bacterium]
MNAVTLQTIYNELFAWCEAEDFSGYDPFDALNSRIFQRSPLKYFSLARLAWLQMVKRSANENLRPKLKIEKGVNSKGIALFALAELSRFRATGETKHAENSKKLLEKLLALKIEIQNPQSAIQNRAAFGYNFDWQSRAFFAPKGTPTIVPTAFATRAFLEAYAVFKTPEYLTTAQEISRFIIEDLNRPFETDEEICFSYTPLDKSIIFNASLLAGKTLGSVGAITRNWECINLAEKSARFVLRRQRADGAWAYGSKFRHQWIDNFHTASILLSLFRLQKTIPKLREEIFPAIEKGLNFWLDNFFLADGTPKYYDRETFPVDIHSASAAIVALCELNEIDARCQPLAEKVAGWTIENMRDSSGFFYYQKRKSETVKAPFIRWAQAWTAYAIARLLEETSRELHK